ncbi:amidohydrolase family protein [Clostridium botulinum]|uniref:Amidohydrolase family protein n=1 Tax=Clostridium botulinum TaxID=1491 RepID=A0A846J4L9_CLOBO|nr:amidohydrolase family protein [Clostridium botulinum]ACA54989.1 amidohydrolase [Clostridium botulinum A3 str. Loch Maree]NFH64467.1 amidohydrolase family protein [Clostridium botulinum]NFJ08201.1 amidohydrolase family protein [Clostridium botulinum]NFK15967.1 amidohydrolase family protein [Clostridium botulinum]NFM93134.1 amidohydrolase family protein [Clostridium botulinum]
MNNNCAFINCNVINGNINSEIQNNMVILVNNTGTIYKIGKKTEIDIPSNYKIIDIDNKFVMPGLINAHVHLFSSGKPMKAASNDNLQKLLFKFFDTRLGKALLKNSMKNNVITALNSGVTTLRCVGDVLYKDVEIRNEINNCSYLGPNLIVSGYMISVTGGHGAPHVSIISDSPWEGRKCVRKNVKEKVDFIKICITGGVTDARMVGEAGRLQMTEEEVSAICDEAHKIGLLVAAHVESKEGLRIALKGGVDTIEHGSEMDDEIIDLFKNNPKSLRGYSALIPTLHAAIPMNNLEKSITKINEITKQNSSIVCNGMISGIKQALASGIKIGLGTDASMAYVTHYNTWRELDYLVRYVGITPQQAIYHATKSNAEIIGIDNYTGSLDIGKYADFIVLDENPLQNIKTLSKPCIVVTRGNVINKPKIKKLKKIDDLLEFI